MALSFATTLRNNMMDEITAFAGTSAKIKIYSGSRPSGGGTPTGTLLVTLTCNATAFAGSASGGVLTLNSISNGTAVASGTASWARITTSADAYVMDADVGTSGADITIDDTSITINGTVAASGTQTLTAPNAS